MSKTKINKANRGEGPVRPAGTKIRRQMDSRQFGLRAKGKLRLLVGDRR